MEVAEEIGIHRPKCRLERPHQAHAQIREEREYVFCPNVGIRTACGARGWSD